jgi:hypothetical protein
LSRRGCQRFLNRRFRRTDFLPDKQIETPSIETLGYALLDILNIAFNIGSGQCRNPDAVESMVDWSLTHILYIYMKLGPRLQRRCDSGFLIRIAARPPAPLSRLFDQADIYAAKNRLAYHCNVSSYVNDLKAHSKIIPHFGSRCIPSSGWCKNSEYPDIPAFSRLVVRAPQHPKLRTYFFMNS